LTAFKEANAAQRDFNTLISDQLRLLKSDNELATKEFKRKVKEVREDKQERAQSRAASKAAVAEDDDIDDIDEIYEIAPRRPKAKAPKPKRKAVPYSDAELGFDPNDYPNPDEPGIEPDVKYQRTVERVKARAEKAIEKPGTAATPIETNPCLSTASFLRRHGTNLYHLAKKKTN
jgi:hypothetical protein